MTAIRYTTLMMPNFACSPIIDTMPTTPTTSSPLALPVNSCTKNCPMACMVLLVVLKDCATAFTGECTSLQVMPISQRPSDSTAETV